MPTGLDDLPKLPAPATRALHNAGLTMTAPTAHPPSWGQGSRGELLRAGCHRRGRRARRRWRRRGCAQVGADVVVAQGVVDVLELAAGGADHGDVVAASGGDGVPERPAFG